MWKKACLNLCPLCDRRSIKILYIKNQRSFYNIVRVKKEKKMDVKSQQTTSTEQSCLFVPEYILYIIFLKSILDSSSFTFVIFPYWFACFYRKKFPFLKKQTKKTKQKGEGASTPKEHVSFMDLIKCWTKEPVRTFCSPNVLKLKSQLSQCASLRFTLERCIQRCRKMKIE